VTTDVLGKREFYEPDGAFVSALIDPRPRPELEDVENHADHRQVPIEQVGVSDLRYPIIVLDRAAESQRTVATMTLSVGLPQDTKGTHMSRFIHVLERHRGELTVRTLPAVLQDLKASLDAKSARIEVAEASASAPVYALLKREDERHLTMQAYDNPVLVEDMVRNAAVRLREDARVTWFRIRAENHESIHNHNAFAQVSFSRPKA
jgi:GTP cyclohydrolase FolE2